MYTKAGLPVWVVSCRNLRTGEVLDLEVPAKTAQKATSKCVALFNYDEGGYTWTGTGPLYVEEE